MQMRIKTLDEARQAYLDGKLTASQFAWYLKRFAIGDGVRRKTMRRIRKLEQKLREQNLL